jgi:hypothetical protein
MAEIGKLEGFFQVVVLSGPPRQLDERSDDGLIAKWPVSATARSSLCRLARASNRVRSSSKLPTAKNVFWICHMSQGRAPVFSGTTGPFFALSVGLCRLSP